MKLWQKVTIGLFLGVLFGVYLSEYTSVIKPIGDAFLRMIQMIIIPLIFFSLVSGITSMNDPSSLGRVGFKAVVAFLGTTVFAVAFGIIIALILKPGEGVQIDFGLQQESITAKSFNIIEFFLNLFDPTRLLVATLPAPIVPPPCLGLEVPLVPSRVVAVVAAWAGRCARRCHHRHC